MQWAGRGLPQQLENQVEPFELVDRTRPGSLKILAFYLVHPSKTIPSSAMISAQQQEAQPGCACAQETESSKLYRVGCAHTRHDIAEALKHRFGLMEARSHLDEYDDELGPNLYFSLCNHC